MEKKSSKKMIHNLAKKKKKSVSWNQLPNNADARSDN